MIKKFLFLVGILAGVSTANLMAQFTNKQMKIKAILDVQTEAWNRGDIPDFMKTYWADDQLQFLSSSGPTFGFENTLQNYYERYPDRQAMGKLHFDIVTINKRSRKVYSLIGKYHLQRDELEDLEGHFLLILQKIKGQWKIVADSTH